MLTYLLLELRRTYRDRRFVFLTLAVPAGIYLLWSNVFGKGGHDPASGLSPQVYLMVSIASFGAIGAALTTTGARLAAERQNGWLRQLKVTPLPARAVITAKTIASMTLALPSIVLVALLAIVTEGVSLPVSGWVGLIALMWLATLPFAALGTLIGSLLGADAAQPLTAGCYFLLAILGGLWMPTAQLPGILRAVAHWTPSNRFAELGWDIAAGHAPSGMAGLVLAAWTVVLGAGAILAYRRTAVTGS
jgi:ABC-2 type transport system permease protein